MVNSYKLLLDRFYSLSEVCVNNASDDLWEKKVGGDFYWEQLYHAVSVAVYALDGKDKVDMPIKKAGKLDGSITDEPHTKEVLLKSIDLSKNYVLNYVDKLDEAKLSAKRDFYGNEVSLYAVLMFVISHIAYHVGVCDAALRDNGLKASM